MLVMAPKNDDEPKKRTSGPSGATQPEGERKRKQRLMRLTDRELRDLDLVAERWGVSRSDAVARLAREELER